MAPPPDLLDDCPEPPPPAERTNQGLIQGILDLMLALHLCNADKAALREFYR